MRRKILALVCVAAVAVLLLALSYSLNVVIGKNRAGDEPEIQIIKNEAGELNVTALAAVPFQLTGTLGRPRVAARPRSDTAAAR